MAFKVSNYATEPIWFIRAFNHCFVSLIKMEKPEEKPDEAAVPVLAPR
jgi:hypothetical protein